MLTSTATTDSEGTDTVDVLVPLIRAAATIVFAISPCSLGFVILAMSEQLIRCIMVGEDPEMLMSELQNQFPNAPLKICENQDAALMAKVVKLFERPEQAKALPLEIRGTDFRLQVWDELRKMPAGSSVNYTFLAEQIPT